MFLCSLLFYIFYIKINKYRQAQARSREKKSETKSELNILHNCYWHGREERKTQEKKILSKQQRQQRMESEIRWKEIFFNLHQHVLYRCQEQSGEKRKVGWKHTKIEIDGENSINVLILIYGEDGKFNHFSVERSNKTRKNENYSREQLRERGDGKKMFKVIQMWKMDY